MLAVSYTLSLSLTIVYVCSRALVRSPVLPFPLAFMSTALLAASTTFAIPLLFGASTDLERARSAIERFSREGPPAQMVPRVPNGSDASRSAQNGTYDSTSSMPAHSFNAPIAIGKLPFKPNESIEEYASSRIFKVLEILESFDIAGDYAAKVCRQLLLGLFTSRKELQQRVDAAQRTSTILDPPNGSQGTIQDAANMRRSSSVSGAFSDSQPWHGQGKQGNAAMNGTADDMQQTPVGNLTIPLPPTIAGDTSFLDT